MDITKAYNFRRIDNLTSCSGTIETINMQSLADADYKVVINLLPDSDKRTRKNEKEEVEVLDLQYFYIPVEWENPKKSDFDTFESIMNSIKDKKVHIHCAANFRVSAFYSVYAYRNLGWSHDKKNKLIDSIWDMSEHSTWNNFIAKLTD